MSPAPCPIPAVFRIDPDHAIAEFAQGVQLVSEIQDGKEVQTAAQIGDLVKSLTKELQEQVRTRPHPLIYANLAFIIGIIFWTGVCFQRINDLDARVKSAANSDTIAASLTNLTEQQNQMRRDLESMRERIDRVLDKR